MSFYPAFLEPYAPYITLILFFVDGLIFGAASRAGAKAIVLIILGLAIADIIGFAIVATLARTLLSQVISDLVEVLKSFNFSSITLTFGVFLWVVGFVVGFVTRSRRSR